MSEKETIGMTSNQPETTRPNPSRGELRRARGIAVVLAVSTVVSILCLIYANIKKTEANQLRQVTIELRVQALETKEIAERALQEAEQQRMMAVHSQHEAMLALKECNKN